VTRCYSISSSPPQSRHHVDITVKRAPGGIVSCYLHDHAAIGLTVNARPPAGRFVLPDPPPRRLLCLAAGSGITPVMSILRWIDDACLPIEAALIYSVRTADEIIFGPELERLAKSMPGLRVMVTLTQPPDGWDGERGRLGREMIERCCPDLGESMVYLCGPGPFMEAARALLVECGVPVDRIRQESFGKQPRPEEPAGAGRCGRPRGPARRVRALRQERRDPGGLYAPGGGRAVWSGHPLELPSGSVRHLCHPAAGRRGADGCGGGPGPGAAPPGLRPDLRGKGAGRRPPGCVSDIR
jgi:ferredoxin-NADP reductase